MSPTPVQPSLEPRSGGTLLDAPLADPSAGVEESSDESTEVLAKLDPRFWRARVSRWLLLVEDNPGDVRLVREALTSVSVPLDLIIAHDGLEALTLLQRAGRKPDLILLDLNLPALDGRVVLHRIKSDPGLLSIPVIVLTHSDAPQDVWRAYCLHANCYLVKPSDYAGFERAMRRLFEFWAGMVHLPGR